MWWREEGHLWTVLSMRQAKPCMPSWQEAHRKCHPAEHSDTITTDLAEGRWQGEHQAERHWSQWFTKGRGARQEHTRVGSADQQELEAIEPLENAQADSCETGALSQEKGRKGEGRAERRTGDGKGSHKEGVQTQKQETKGWQRSRKRLRDTWK